MLEQLKILLAPPIFEDDEEKTRLAALLNIIFLMIIVLMSTFLFVEITTNIFYQTLTNAGSFFNNFTLIIVSVILIMVMRVGYVKESGYLVALFAWVNITYQAMGTGGVRDGAFTAYIIVIVATGILVGRWYGVGMFFLCTFSGFLLAYAEVNNMIPRNIDSPYMVWRDQTLNFAFVTILIFLAVGSLEKSLIKSHQHEAALEKSNQELQEIRVSLEERVEKRTRQLVEQNNQLSLITLLSNDLNSILELDLLLQTMVNRIQESFGYYHVHVYLVDEEDDHLSMVAGFGEVGRILKERQHQLKVGQGIVGTVAKSHKSFISNDVNTVANFVRNPLLPDTQAELAVPLRKNARVLGVLDIQSEQKNFFQDDDVTIMQAIADQAAIALDNSRLLLAQKETIRALQEANKLNEEYTNALETSTDISQQITAILDLQELLQFVVTRINTGFHLYHTHIYLVDERAKTLLMVEGYGEVGAKLKAKGHQLAVGQGIVGTVAAINHHFLSNDVDTVENFVRNPLLPLTNAELAVPMRKGSKVLGVLDVQSKQRNRFTDNDVALMQSIGDQIAIAVDNARLLTNQQATIRKLQEVDRLKSQFLTMMSHELRTPLNAVLGFAELLIYGMSGELPDQAQKDAQLIYDNGKHLLNLINDIIDITKIESGLIQVSKQAVDVPDLMNDVASAAHAFLRDKSIEIVVSVAEDVPSIEADPTRLKQILLNLVGNAIKFTEEGHVTLKAEAVNDAIRFAVIDTGIGIPLDKQEEIFEAFKQADMSDTREYGGTGLGLNICQELVAMHDGKMGVQSEVGVGSEFYFTIPIGGDKTAE